MAHVPKKPNDEDPHSHHHAVLHERVLQGQGLLVAGAGIRISSNADGQYRIESTAVSVAATSGKQDFVMVSDGGDYYNCYTYDGLNTGTVIVKVAKHQDLRCILPSADPSGGAWESKTIRGITYDYTYTASAATTADGVNVIEYIRAVAGDDASSETDYVTPALVVGDIISALPASFLGPETLIGVEWQALADGRAWAAPAA